MVVTYFTNLNCRRSFRAVHAQHSGRLYVELLAQTDHARTVRDWEPTCEADLGHVGTHDITFLSTVAAGAVELGRAQFYSLN